MRLSDQEITSQAAIEAIIEEAKFCRLGLVDGDQPYVVPLLFGYQDKTLYFHCALEGRKIDIIKKNPKVCFEVDVSTKLIGAEEACSWDLIYKSVIGFGKAYLVEDLDEKKKGFRILMAHYSSKTYHIPDKDIEESGIIRMDIEEMTGKHSET